MIKAPRRRGTVLPIALVCLLVIMSLLGHMLLGALRITRQLHAERNLQQCELLLQAGVDRGLSQVAGQPDFAGETFDLPSENVIGQGDARVTIEIRRGDVAPTQLQVSAEYPLGDEHSVRRSRNVSVPSNTP